jgi:hypothetical protein
MPVTLPFDFDTGRETRRLLKGVVALLAVMLAGGLVMLIVRHDALGAAGTLLIDAMLVGFGVILLRMQPGARGRIARDAVETRTQRVWGIALPGPVGRFAVADFESVRVERVLASGNRSTTLRPIERTTLVGRPGTPDVPVLAGRVDGDASPGEALARALQLPCEVVRAPARVTLR